MYTNTAITTYASIAGNPIGTVNNSSAGAIRSPKPAYVLNAPWVSAHGKILSDLILSQLKNIPNSTQKTVKRKTPITG